MERMTTYDEDGAPVILGSCLDMRASGDFAGPAAERLAKLESAILQVQAELEATSEKLAHYKKEGSMRKVMVQQLMASKLQLKATLRALGMDDDEGMNGR